MTGFDLILYGALAAAAQGPAPDARLTIDQAAAIAATRAFAVRLQQSGLLRQNAVVRQAESGLGPQVTGSVSATRGGQATNFNTGGSTLGGTTGGTTGGGTTGGTTGGGTTGGTTGGGTTGGGTTGGTSGGTTGGGTTGGGTGGTSTGGTGQTLFSNNSVAYGVFLSLPIDLSGALHRNLRSAEAARRGQAQTVLQSVNDARLNARTAFLNLLRARAAVEVQRAAVTNAQAQAEQARLQLLQVQVAKVDVDRLNAQVAQTQSDLIDAQNQLDLALYALNFALARPIDTPVDPVDVTGLPDTPTDAPALDQAARAARPDVLAARERVESFAQIRAAAEHLNFPNLNLTLGQQRFGSGFGFSGQRSNTSVGVSLSVPIFDGGYIRSRVGQARQDEEAAKINLQQIELTASQDVRNALANLRSARARLESATRQVELAQEVFRIAQVRQAAGAGTYVETIDAQTQLTTARNNLVRARYDVLTAYAQLQRAVGTDRLPAAPGAPQP